MFDEDEDLEALRLAALKTVQKKAAAETSQVTPPQPVIPPQYAPVNQPLVTPFLPHTAPIVPGNWDHMPYHPNAFNPAGFVPIGAPPIVPILPSPGIPIVVPTPQLSPRSAAFVSMNNDILARRKQAKSPPYNRSPGRWSRSPSPARKYRRSISRSPSPKVRRRSRSPPPRHRSPIPRRRSPAGSPRRRSPPRNGRYRSANNSPVPPRRRSRSPLRRRSPVGVRPGSRSPARKLNRNPQNADRRKKTPEKPKPKEEKAKSRSKSKSLSPAASLERILANMDEEFKFELDDKVIDDDDDLLAKMELAEQEDYTPPPRRTDKPVVEEKKKEEPKPEPPVKKALDIEDELLASDDDEVLNADIDMDLFASEESESENEGRFKTGAKTERKTTSVVPFSKLTGVGSTTAEAAPTTDRRKDDSRGRRADPPPRRREDRRAELKRDERPKTPDHRTKVSSTVTIRNEPKKEERRTLRRPITGPKEEAEKEASRKPIRLRLGGIVSDKEEKSNGESSSKGISVSSTVGRPRTKITY